MTILNNYNSACQSGVNNYVQFVMSTMYSFMSMVSFSFA